MPLSVLKILCSLLFDILLIIILLPFPSDKQYISTWILQRFLIRKFPRTMEGAWWNSERFRTKQSTH